MGVDSEDLIGLGWVEARLEHPAQQHGADLCALAGRRLGRQRSWQPAASSRRIAMLKTGHAATPSLTRRFSHCIPTSAMACVLGHARQVASSRECCRVLSAIGRGRGRRRMSTRSRMVCIGTLHASNSLSSNTRASSRQIFSTVAGGLVA
ncbi:hypothetical protein BC831DRAFT_441482 [Entophlyctis helioformis]|nr:hypothetical protein BC831DRAFT_441482 [Entophlyctis helioformis]